MAEILKENQHSIKAVISETVPMKLILSMECLPNTLHSVCPG